jgi:hypothetical protein
MRKIVEGKAGKPWYNPKDYPKLVQLFTDGSEFPECYDEWLDLAEEEERHANARGTEIVRIMIEPAAFSKWCKLRGLAPGVAARKDYARRGCLRGRPPKD